MRLLTRSDFDGLACGVLLKELGVIEDFKFVHPKDLQDGLVEVNENDLLANVPYVPGCGMWFDHHSSEDERLNFDFTFKGSSKHSPSAARVIYEYYDGNKTLTKFDEMMVQVDKVDSGALNLDEILNPTGWVLLGFIMDPRTGLGRFRNFRISNYQLMETLIDICRTTRIEEILALEDVKERIDVYIEQNTLYKEMIFKHTKKEKNVIFTDLRGVETIYTGNRFLIYSLYPDQNISVWVIDGKNKQNCAIAVGHSIINRTSKTNVGKLMLKNGGGGHQRVGTCQVPYEMAEVVIRELIDTMNNEG